MMKKIFILLAVPSLLNGMSADFNASVSKKSVPPLPLASLHNSCGALSSSGRIAALQENPSDQERLGEGRFLKESSILQRRTVLEKIKKIKELAAKGSEIESLANEVELFLQHALSGSGVQPKLNRRMSLGDPRIKDGASPRIFDRMATLSLLSPRRESSGEDTP